MSAFLDTILLLALPASGKSETRRYMESLTPDQCKNDMCMGPTLQLDDYPYVHFMHRIDDELKKRGWNYIFYGGPERPFLDAFTWGTLIELLNEDYDDLLKNKIYEVPSAAQFLFDRLDNAMAKVGLERQMDKIPYGIRRDVAEAMEAETREHLIEKNKVSAQDKTGKTVVIEMARGAVNGSAFPVTPPNGYQYSITQFSHDILSRSGILYIWVTPEQSRQKNYERARPDGQSSILNHGVPLEVMLGQYGCDDIDYLISLSDKKDTIKVEKAFETTKNGKRVYDTKAYHLPIAKFDNREDLTTFVREDKSKWNKADVQKIHNGLSNALKSLKAKML
ncbi:MAG: hypothetical protein HQK49_12060 [Oligoflexia bacterium]|nr:hypothetical protein [Oligoflexia bacterium]